MSWFKRSGKHVGDPGLVPGDDFGADETELPEQPVSGAFSQVHGEEHPPQRDEGPKYDQEELLQSDQGEGPTLDELRAEDEQRRDPSSSAPALRERIELQMPAHEQAPQQGARLAQPFPEPLVIGSRPPSFRSTLGRLPSIPAVISDCAVPDTVLDGADLPGLTIRGASLRGDEHRYAAKVCQDSMGMWQIADQDMAAVMVCAADGVGSEPLSHQGAADACRLLRDLAQRNVSRLFRAAGQGNLPDFWQYMAEDIAVQLTKMAERVRVDPKALSTTLAGALVEAEPMYPAERRYVILNVGDATAYMLRDGKFDRCFADPHAGTISETSTWALPTSVGQVGTATGTISPGDMLMVCTDGMSNPMSNREVLEQLAMWWGNDHVPSLQEFGWQLSYRVRSFGDDRTAVCIWNR